MDIMFKLKLCLSVTVEALNLKRKYSYEEVGYIGFFASPCRLNCNLLGAARIFSLHPKDIFSVYTNSTTFEILNLIFV